MFKNIFEVDYQYNVFFNAISLICDYYVKSKGNVILATCTMKLQFAEFPSSSLAE